MNAVARKSQAAKNPAVTPDAVEHGVAPPATTNWQHERDAGHIWTAMTSLRGTVGELQGAILACNQQIIETRQDIKEIDTCVKTLQTEQVSTQKTLKMFAFIATPLLGLVAWFAPSYWSGAMRPELEKSIAASVKAEIDKDAIARDRIRALEAELAAVKAQQNGR